MRYTAGQDFRDQGMDRVLTGGAVDETDRLRVVPEASIKKLEETGFFTLLQPRRFDGLESDPIDFYTAVRDIASACGSTGWVSAVVGVHPWQVALFTDEAQQAVWGSDTTTQLSSSYAPTGKAVVTEGGFQLSGRWSFSSGSRGPGELGAGRGRRREFREVAMNFLARHVERPRGERS